jgi:hypothetical protein
MGLRWGGGQRQKIGSDMAKYTDITYELLEVDVRNPTITDSNNRYFSSVVYTDGGEKFFEFWDIPEIPIDSRDAYYKIGTGEVGRWDLISYRAYGTVLYWWLICVANGVRNPLIVIPAGDMIRIPYLPTLNL